MKPHWLITLSLTLLLAMACSKDEEATEEGPDTSEPAAPPAENTEPPTPSEPENTETNSEPSNASTNATSFPIPNPTANLPAGKQRDWSYGTGQPADLDRAYIGQPASVITNAFGMPNSFTNVNGLIVWNYDQMKISWQGTNYNKARVILAPDPQVSARVRTVTVDPSSAVLSGDSGDPDAPSPAP